jgi:protein SCO1/2
MQPKNWMSIAAAGLVLTAAAYISVGRLSAEDTPWGANYFPNSPLITQDGKTVHFYDDVLKGKTVAIYLMYTSCGYSCPLETARMVQVKKYLGDRVGKDIFFYSITIYPKHDTPEVLKKYSEQYHTGAGWTFLTGDAKDIELISKKLGLYSDPDPANKDGHTAKLLIGDEPSGQWIRNSALDNPKYVSVMIGNWLGSIKNVPAQNTGTVVAGTLPVKTKPGHYIFTTQCAPCHSIGHGDNIGPDLLGVTDVREKEWLTHFIRRPQEMVEAGDPIAKTLYEKYKQVKMPNLYLGPRDVADVISFLEAQTAAAKANAPSAAAKPASPEPVASPK